MIIGKLIQIHKLIGRFVIALFPYIFLSFIMLVTGGILFSGLPISDMLSFLGMFYLAAAMIYGAYRFLKWIVSDNDLNR